MKKKLNLEEAVHRIKEINKIYIGWIPAVRGGIRGHFLNKQAVRYHSSQRKEQFLGVKDGKRPWIHLNSVQEIIDITKQFSENFTIDYDFGGKYLSVSFLTKVSVSNGNLSKSEILLKFSLKDHCSVLEKKEILEMITPFLHKEKQDAIIFFLLEEEFAM